MESASNKRNNNERDINDTIIRLRYGHEAGDDCAAGCQLDLYATNNRTTLPQTTEQNHLKPPKNHKKVWLNQIKSVPLHAKDQRSWQSINNE